MEFVFNNKQKDTKKQLWLVFYYKDKEMMSYTLYGTFAGEKQATIDMLCSDLNCEEQDIRVEIEER